jgi:hypothetical protein
MVWGGLRLVVAIIVRYRSCRVWVLTAFWGTLFQLAVSPFNWIESMKKDVARRVGVMMDNEAARAPEGEDTEAQNLEDLRRKYPWWLNGRVGNVAAAPDRNANAEDVVILFEGKNTRVRRTKETTSSRVM